MCMGIPIFIWQINIKGISWVGYLIDKRILLTLPDSIKIHTCQLQNVPKPLMVLLLY